MTHLLTQLRLTTAVVEEPQESDEIVGRCVSAAGSLVRFLANAGRLIASRHIAADIAQHYEKNQRKCQYI
jgi:hypothetical protein